MVVVSHNISSMFSNRQLGITTDNKAKSTEKLSSGYKINRAADDAAGLSISEKMRRQIRGLKQATDNAEDGISLVQTADGAMEEIMDMLHRANELAIKAANGTNSESDRSDIDQELQQIKAEIDQMPEKTKFNEIYVLKGMFKTYNADGGYQADAVIVGKLPDFVTIDGNSASQGILADKYKESADYSYSYQYLDSNGIVQTATESGTRPDIEHDAARVDFSAFSGSAAQKKELDGTGFYSTCCTCSNHYSVKFHNGGYSGNNPERSGVQRVYHIDISSCSTGEDIVNSILAVTGKTPDNHYTNFIKDPVNSNGLIMYDNRPGEKNLERIMLNDISAANGHTMLSGSGYILWDSDDLPNPYWNIHPNKEYAFGLVGEGVAYDKREYITDVRQVNTDLVLQVGTDNRDDNRINILLPCIDNPVCRLTETNLKTIDNAREAIDKITDALSYVSGERSRMGAYHNRIEHTVRNLDNVVENTQAVESRIRDTDMAEEMVNFSKENILQQAGQSLLAQANQDPQSILQLLQ